MSRIQCLQLRQRQGADALVLAGGEATAAALQQPHRELKLAGFEALLSPPFLPEPEDLLVGHALGEILQGDAANGADLRDWSGREACQQVSDGGIGDLVLQGDAGLGRFMGSRPRCSCQA